MKRRNVLYAAAVAAACLTWVSAARGQHFLGHGPCAPCTPATCTPATCDVVVCDSYCTTVYEPCYCHRPCPLLGLVHEFFFGRNRCCCCPVVVEPCYEVPCEPYGYGCGCDATCQTAAAADRFVGGVPAAPRAGAAYSRSGAHAARQPGYDGWRPSPVPVLQLPPAPPVSVANVPEPGVETPAETVRRLPRLQ